MAERFCKVCRGWHDLGEPWPPECVPPRKDTRSGIPAPMLIPDGMEPVKSMLDGKMYDSKAALRATYKAAGVAEVGNDSSLTDPKPFKKPAPDKNKIRAALDKGFSRAGLGA